MRVNAILCVLATSFASTSALVARGVYPSCSIPCFTNADTGYCSPVDNACLCTNNPYLRSTTDCIQSSCSPADLQAAAVVAQATCKAAGVDILTNPAASPTGTTGGSSVAATGARSSSTSTSNAMIGFTSNKGILITGFAAAAAALIL